MIAWKFLAPDARGPFTGFRWPRPEGGRPGPWVSAPEGTPWEKWIFACRRGDLPFWLDEELWRAELSGAVRESEYQVAAARARLVERVAAWDAAARLAFGESCALAARDAAAAALEAAGERAAAASLRGASGLAQIQAAAEGLQAGAQPAGGYVADAARTARAGRAATAGYAAAVLAAAVAGPPAAERERARQSEWLALRLGL